MAIPDAGGSAAQKHTPERNRPGALGHCMAVMTDMVTIGG
jgi:hypothetical protein